MIVSRCTITGILFLSLAAGVLSGCSRKDRADIGPAFYYWRTHFEITAREAAYLGHSHSRKLYVKFLDIDREEGRIVRKSSITADTPGHEGERLYAAGDTLSRLVRYAPEEVIPTFFITNRTFVEMHADSDAEELARIVAGHFSVVFHRLFPTLSLKEVQCDCDWTAGTRRMYFAFLGALKSQLADRHLLLSTTIRLHQVKYRETMGVPPADRGMLMYYNMGSLDDPRESNSILNTKKAGAYLPYLNSYPLPLDVALPLFSWGVVERRHQVAALLNEVSADDFSDSTRFRISSHGATVEVLESTYFNYNYLYKGDLIRLESIAVNDLRDAAEELERWLPRATGPRVVSFFDISPSTTGRYRYEDLVSIARSF